MIAAEEHGDLPRIVVVTCEGERTGVDATHKVNKIHHWVRKSTEPSLKFDPWKERQTYKKVRKEMIEPEWVALNSNTPCDRPLLYDTAPVYDHSKR